MNDTQIELTIRCDQCNIKRLAVAISDDVARELMAGVELSDNPLSLLLASPGLMGGTGNALTIRRAVFRMRRELAEEIASAMVPAILEAFGVNDELDGYSVDKMSPDERAWHQKRGRIT